MIPDQTNRVLHLFGKMASGKMTTDITAQCNVHNEQFQSVFTPKSPLNLSRLTQMKLQDMVDIGRVSPDTVRENSQNKNQTMPDIEISLNGILKLLFNLKPFKAAGSDKIRPQILKEFRVELAPIIKVIFERSLETGKLPTDCVKHMSHQYIRKVKNHWHPTTVRFPLPAFCVRSLNTFWRQTLLDT